MTNRLYEAKQMTAMKFAGAASRVRDACRQQMSIVKVVFSTTGFCEEPFEMLELPEGKLSRAVLRGRERGNSLLLPDPQAHD